jgi:hypothetical protein
MTPGNAAKAIANQNANSKLGGFGHQIVASKAILMHSNNIDVTTPILAATV